MIIRFAILLILNPIICFSQIEGKVISIADGDTFTILIDKKELKIRLHGIDCPESSQDFGNVAKQYLSNLIFGKTVRVKEMDVDRYGRTIGMVFHGAANINEELLKAGMAWHYKQYDKNEKWAKIELEAKESKMGLWIQPNPKAPWIFRKEQREK